MIYYTSCTQAALNYALENILCRLAAVTAQLTLQIWVTGKVPVTVV